jgi:hypothetical protein
MRQVTYQTWAPASPGWAIGVRADVGRWGYAGRSGGAIADRSKEAQRRRSRGEVARKRIEGRRRLHLPIGGARHWSLEGGGRATDCSACSFPRRLGKAEVTLVGWAADGLSWTRRIPNKRKFCQRPSFTSTRLRQCRVQVCRRIV